MGGLHIDFADDYLLDSSLAAGDVQLVSPTGDAATQIDRQAELDHSGVEYVVTLSGFSRRRADRDQHPGRRRSNSLGEQSPAASGVRSSWRPCRRRSSPAPLPTRSHPRAGP